jgi:hypothetical protein
VSMSEFLLGGLGLLLNFFDPFGAVLAPLRVSFEEEERCDRALSLLRVAMVILFKLGSDKEVMLGSSTKLCHCFLAVIGKSTVSPVPSSTYIPKGTKIVL